LTRHAPFYIAGSQPIHPEGDIRVCPGVKTPLYPPDLAAKSLICKDFHARDLRTLSRQDTAEKGCSRRIVIDLSKNGG